MKTIGSIITPGHVLQVLQATYRQGTPAFVLQSAEGMPCGNLSVNVPGIDLEEGEFLAKTWSENEPLRGPALASGLFIDTQKRVDLGHVEAEVWKRSEVH